MKRVLLNVVCFGLIVLSCIGIVLIIKDAKTNPVDNLGSYQQKEQYRPEMNQNDRGERPAINNGEEAPEPPEGDMAGMSGERPEKPNNDMGIYRKVKDLQCLRK